MSELLSLVVEPITNGIDGGDVIDSTGDMFGKISELNESGVIKN